MPKKIYDLIQLYLFDRTEYIILLSSDNRFIKFFDKLSDFEYLLSTLPIEVDIHLIHLENDISIYMTNINYRRFMKKYGNGIIR